MSPDSYLLDTHVLLWWVDDDDRLGQPARDVVRSARRVVVSDVSLWELAIKSAAGKLVFRPDVRTWFERRLAEERFGSLSITRDHLDGVAEMPLHHRDPFDRLLIAQAQTEHLTLVTGDPAFAAYDVDVVW